MESIPDPQHCLLPEVGHLLLLPLEDGLLDPLLCLEALDPGLVAPRLFLQLRQLPVLPQVRLSATGGFFVFNTASSAAPQSRFFRRSDSLQSFNLTGRFFRIFLLLCMCCIQHSFICRPSDSTVSKDAGIEPRTVATRSNSSTTWLDLIHF
jgi:hypothetical protein